MIKKKLTGKKKTAPKSLQPDEIIQEIKAKLASSSGKTTIGPIVSLIRKNLPSKNFTKFIDPLINFAKDQPWFTQLALDYVSRVGEKKKDSDQAFIRRLTLISRKLCNFPLDETRPIFAAPISDEEEESVNEWIIDSRDEIVDAHWCRATLISLMTLEEKSLSERNLRLIHRFMMAVHGHKSNKSTKSPKNIKKLPARESQVYLKRVASSFLSYKPSLPKLSLILDISAPILRYQKECQLTQSRLSSELSSSQADLRERTEKVATLESDNRNLTQSKKLLEENLSHLEEELSQEQEKVQKLRVWWEDKVQTEKKANLNKFKRALEHEVSDALISLDGNDPNVSMALDKLRRIMKMIVEPGEQ